MTVLLHCRDLAGWECLLDEAESSSPHTANRNENRHQGKGAQVTSELHPAVQAAKDWFDSPTGIGRSVTLVANSRYPFEPRSLRDEALGLIWQTVFRNPHREFGNIEAYCQTTMRNLCRAWSKQRILEDLDKLLGTLSDDEAAKKLDIDTNVLDGDDVIDQIAHSSELDRYPDIFTALQVSSLTTELEAARSPELAVHFRSAVEVVSGCVDVKAAVLNFLTLTVDPDADCSDLPQPKRGATQRQARWWAAIALAVQDPSYFPSEKGSPDAQRKKLGRFMRQCEQVIISAATSYTGKENNNG